MSYSHLRQATAILLSITLWSIILTNVSVAENRWILVEGGNWPPITDDILDIQERLQTYVNTQAMAQERHLQDWDRYTFQYQGQFKHGERSIFINAFCIEADDRPLNKLMLFALDGGSCFFNLRYDPVHSKFYDLVINGEG